MLEDEKRKNNPARVQLMRKHIVEALVAELHAHHTTCVVIVVSAKHVWHGAKVSISWPQFMLRRPLGLQIPETAPLSKRLRVWPHLRLPVPSHLDLEPASGTCLCRHTCTTIPHQSSSSRKLLEGYTAFSAPMHGHI